MGGLSIWHWIIVGIAILLLFGGRGKISEMMGDMAKGIKAFKKGMAEDEQPTAEAAAPPQVPPPVAPHASAGTTAQAHRG